MISKRFQSKLAGEITPGKRHVNDWEPGTTLEQSKSKLSTLLTVRPAGSVPVSTTSSAVPSASASPTFRTSTR
jgi:hypothetical protein